MQRRPVRPRLRFARASASEFSAAGASGPLFPKPTGLADGLAPKERRYEQAVARFAPRRLLRASDWVPRLPRVRPEELGRLEMRRGVYGRVRRIPVRVFFAARAPTPTTKTGRPGWSPEAPCVKISRASGPAGAESCPLTSDAASR